MATETQILGHWYHLIDGLQQSSQDFYAALDQEIASRTMPKTKTSNVSFSEGGVLSAKRLYLRVQRGEHTFDVCAAPFGRGFFVSWWLVVNPPLAFRLPMWLRWVLLPLYLLRFLFRAVMRLDKETYFKIDTALMFQSTVHDAIQKVLNGLTTAQGLRALTEGEMKPVMRDFFKK